MDFGDYVRLIRRSAWIIVALILVGVLTAATLSLREKPQYGATATGYVSASVGTITDLSQVSAVSQQAVNSFAGVAKSAYVLNQVIEALHLPTTAGALSQQVVAAVPANSSLLTITATAPTADQAAEIANSVMSHLNTAIHTLIPGSNREDVALRLFTVNPATPPGAPDSPKPLRDIAFGALAGLILGLVVAVLRQVLDSRVSTLHDIDRLSDRPVLGLFPKDAQTARGAASIEDFTHSSAAEGFRTLRTNLRFLEGPGTSRSFIVTSPSTNEDRAELAANLAIAIADLGTRVIVVDADLRRPRVAEYLGVREPSGVDGCPCPQGVAVRGHTGLGRQYAARPARRQRRRQPERARAVLPHARPRRTAADGLRRRDLQHPAAARGLGRGDRGDLHRRCADRRGDGPHEAGSAAGGAHGSRPGGIAGTGPRGHRPRYGRLPGRRSRPVGELLLTDEPVQRVGTSTR